MAVSITATMRNALLDGGASGGLKSLDSGFLKLYDGTPPANASAALSGNTLLATLTFASDAFGDSASGVATAAAITSDTTADATGTATFFRLWKSDNTVMLQGTAGTSGTDLILNTASIVAGAVVAVSSLTITMPAS